MDVVAVVASFAGGWAAVDDAEPPPSVRASVWANAWLHAVIVSAAIRVLVLISLWRQVAVKPVSLSERFHYGFARYRCCGQALQTDSLLRKLSLG
jgi:hypothetical protein